MKEKNNLFCEGRHNSMGRFLEACLLCLLKDGEAHGYNLMEKLEGFGFIQGSINISVIYRNLRNMEARGLMESTWTESDQGPNKRIYSITNEGNKALDQWIILLKERQKRITMIIDKYEEKLKSPDF